MQEDRISAPHGVAEYPDAHQGERVTVAKLRWLLGKATAELGEVRLAELSPERVCAWRLTVPEGHRFDDEPTEIQEFARRR